MNWRRKNCIENPCSPLKARNHFMSPWALNEKQRCTAEILAAKILKTRRVSKKLCVSKMLEKMSKEKASNLTKKA